REGLLYRTSRNSTAKYLGFLDDYAFLVQALLELHRASSDARWKDEASTLAKTMLDHFGDQQNGGFYFTARDATDLIVRQKTASDSPLPSGNAVAAIALLELDQSEQARRVLEAFAGQMQRQAEGMSSMVQA